MPDTIAFSRSKTLRQNINRYTGYNDKTVTDGVKRLIRDGGNESYKPLEAAMLLDEFPNPIIAKKEFSRLMDYGDDIFVNSNNEINRLVDYENNIQIKECINISYSRVEYFDTYGDVWCTTDLYPNDWDSVEAHISLSSPLTPGALYGDNSSNKVLILVETWNNTVSNLCYNGQWNEYYGSSLQPNINYYIKTIHKNGEQKYYVNGVLKGSSTRNGTLSNNNKTHFLTYGHWTGRDFYGRFIDISFSLNGNIIRKFYPAKKIFTFSDQSIIYIPAFYEEITNKFFENSGSGSALFGPNLN